MGSAAELGHSIHLEGEIMRPYVGAVECRTLSVDFA
jgi:hypothetical protein